MVSSLAATPSDPPLSSPNGIHGVDITGKHFPLPISLASSSPPTYSLRLLEEADCAGLRDALSRNRERVKAYLALSGENDQIVKSAIEYSRLAVYKRKALYPVIVEGEGRGEIVGQIRLELSELPPLPSEVHSLLPSPPVPCRALSVAYWVDARVEGKGIVTSALRKMLCFALEIFWSDFFILEIHADIAPGNLKSQSVAKRFGFINSESEEVDTTDPSSVKRWLRPRNRRKELKWVLPIRADWLFILDRSFESSRTRKKAEAKAKEKEEAEAMLEVARKVKNKFFGEAQGEEKTGEEDDDEERILTDLRRLHTERRRMKRRQLVEYEKGLSSSSAIDENFILCDPFQGDLNGLWTCNSTKNLLFVRKHEVFVVPFERKDELHLVRVEEGKIRIGKYVVDSLDGDHLVRVLLLRNVQVQYQDEVRLERCELCDSDELTESGSPLDGSYKSSDIEVLISYPWALIYDEEREKERRGGDKVLHSRKIEKLLLKVDSCAQGLVSHSKNVISAFSFPREEEKEAVREQETEGRGIEALLEIWKPVEVVWKSPDGLKEVWVKNGEMSDPAPLQKLAVVSEVGKCRAQVREYLNLVWLDCLRFLLSEELEQLNLRLLMWRNADKAEKASKRASALNADAKSRTEEHVPMQALSSTFATLEKTMNELRMLEEEQRGLLLKVEEVKERLRRRRGLLASKEKLLYILESGVLKFLDFEGSEFLRHTLVGRMEEGDGKEDVCLENLRVNLSRSIEFWTKSINHLESYEAKEFPAPPELPQLRLSAIRGRKGLPPPAVVCSSSSKERGSEEAGLLPFQGLWKSRLAERIEVVGRHVRMKLINQGGRELDMMIEQNNDGSLRLGGFIAAECMENFVRWEPCTVADLSVPSAGTLLWERE